MSFYLVNMVMGRHAGHWEFCSIARAIVALKQFWKEARNVEVGDPRGEKAVAPLASLLCLPMKEF